MVDETIYAYLAGVIDSDGFITIQRTTKSLVGRCKQPGTYHCLKRGIAGTRREPHDLAASIFGGDISRYVPKNAKHRPQYQWSITGPTAVKFLRIIRPYLRIKGIQADLGLRFQEVLEAHIRKQHETQKPPYHITDGMRDERDVFWNEMVSLNQSRSVRHSVVPIGKKD